MSMQMAENPLSFALFGSVLLCSAVLIPAWLVAFFHSSRLSSYMKKEHYQTYLELSGGKVFGIVCTSPGGWLPYIFDKSITSNDQLGTLRDKARKSILFALIWAAVFIASILAGIAIMISIS